MRLTWKAIETKKIGVEGIKMQYFWVQFYCCINFYDTITILLLLKDIIILVPSLGIGINFSIDEINS